jgi:hypothetical protein
MLIGTASAAFADYCPIQLLAGQIARYTGPLDQVILTRGRVRVLLQQHSCILFGDRLDASQVAEVRVATANGETKRIGRSADALVWIPGADQPRSSGTWDFLNRIYGALLDPMRAPPVAAVGRGAGTCRERPEFADQPEPPHGTARPLAALQPGPERIEANLPALLAAWKTDGDAGPLRVELARDDGAILAQRLVCQVNNVALPLTPGVLKAGDRLTLQIRSESGSAPIAYPIAVVAAGALGGSAQDRGPDWSYGAWLLASGPPDTRLDAIAWLATGTRNSYGAFRIMAAILSEEAYQ